MNISTSIWLFIDIVIALEVMVASIAFLRIAPEQNQFRKVKYWHIFNCASLIVCLVPLLFGLKYPYYVQFILIGLILANNFAATVSSISRIQQEQAVVKGILQNHNKLLEKMERN